MHEKKNPEHMFEHSKFLYLLQPAHICMDQGIEYDEAIPTQ